jgi:hypothetical protein
VQELAGQLFEKFKKEVRPADKDWPFALPWWEGINQHDILAT